MLRAAAAEQDSVGGIIECRVQGVPLGLGQPFFDSAESMIAHLLFSVPAVKGVEFGSGFAGARMRGSENNDPFLDVEGTTATNNAGGINGGLTNGNELVVRAAVKPTPSIGREQMTYNLATNKVEPLTIRGRHDVCVALRGAVVVEAASHRAGQLHPLMTTRRDILGRISRRLAPLYGAREARSIALVAVSELSGLSASALLTDPGAPLEIAELDDIPRPAGRRPSGAVCRGAHGVLRPHVRRARRGADSPARNRRAGGMDRAGRNDGHRPLLDVGTGSGCIAATLALALPGAQVYAADISDTALETAARNCRALGAGVILRKADALSDLAKVFPGPFDVIVSNPPYVPQSDLPAMHVNVREYEPHEALLVPDDDPLRFYRAIARAGRRTLRPGGRLYFEIYERFAEAMRRILGEEGYTDTEVREDLNGKPRMTCSRLK